MLSLQSSFQSAEYQHIQTIFPFDVFYFEDKLQIISVRKQSTQENILTHEKWSNSPPPVP